MECWEKEWQQKPCKPKRKLRKAYQQKTFIHHHRLKFVGSQTTNANDSVRFFFLNFFFTFSFFCLKKKESQFSVITNKTKDWAKKKKHTHIYKNEIAKMLQWLHSFPMCTELWIVKPYFISNWYNFCTRKNQTHCATYKVVRVWLGPHYIHTLYCMKETGSKIEILGTKM